jgi:hypothetical protein
MATFNLFHHFGEELHKGTHNFSAHTFRVALSNTAPTQNSDTTLSNVTQITGGGTTGYTTVADGAGATVTLTLAETSANSGVWRLGNTTDVVFTAGAAGFGPFRYAIIINDTPTSPANPVVGYLDYGSSISVTSGNTFTVDPGANGFYEYTVPAAV